MSLEHANCEDCSLGRFLRKSDNFSPVLAETHANDRIFILGEAPGSYEVNEGRPFVGPSGIELQAALDLLGLSRGECHINNVMACCPPKGNLGAFISKLSRINTARNRDKKPTLPTPQKACRGRLLEDMKGFTRVICLGKEAASAIRGGNASIMALRGTCEEVQMPWGMVKVAYTIHPAFVLRVPKWREVFLSDLSRAVRYFRDALSWKEPEIIIVKSAQELMDCFERLVDMGKPVAYDVETGMESPLEARLRCIGIGNEDLSILVPFRRINPAEPDFFTGQEEVQVTTLVRTFLQTAPVPIIGHNAGQFDRLVCERALQVTPKLAADTLLLHLLVNNEMPHNLGFITSYYTDFVEGWKANHIATTTRDDEELHIYCAKDVSSTASIAGPLAQEVKARNQWHLVSREHLLQDIGCGMQRLGMRVDQERLEEHGLAFEVLLGQYTAVCKQIVDTTFNPNSTMQLSNLLFREWKLVPEKYNEKTGMPSTDDDSLRRMITHHNLDAEKVEFLQAIRMVRRYRKLLSTYIRPLQGKLVLSDGRVHPAYNRLPASGRYSSSRPNAQNIPAFLRDIFIPEEGHLFVGSDMDQLELRLIAEEAESKSLLRIINEGLDPHNENMEAVYGKSIWSLDGAPEDRRKKGKGTFKRTRGITKNVFYAWQYAASVPTIHQQVVSVEDDEGKLIYAHLTHRDIRDVVKGLKKANPEIPKWWEKTRQLYRKQGFLVDSLWGRRRDFKNEEKLNELVNHPIQSGGASIVHEAMLQLVMGHPGWGTIAYSSLAGRDLFSFDFEERLGLVNQCHDSLLFEVREDDAEEAAKLLEAAMNRERKSNPLLKYTAEAEIGKNWLET